MKKYLCLFGLLSVSLLSCDTDEAEEKTKYETVDLALPSETLWTSMDLFAEEPSSFGRMFMWGDPNSGTQYANGLSYYENIDHLRYQKYENNKISRLEVEDDPARVFISKEYKTPSKAQWEELNRYCTWARTKDGYYVHGPNSNMIFLHDGEYWTDEIYYDDVMHKHVYKDAWYFSIDENRHKLFRGNREHLFNVRAVK